MICYPVMRRLLFHLCLVLLSLPLCDTQAQAPTRNQLLQLYHKANVAKNKFDYETAIARYGDIIRLVPQLPEPYLYIAELYDANSANDRKNHELAIFFYRKYIDVQLDDKKTISAQQRLIQLESAISVAHFEEYLKEDEAKVEQEYAQFEIELTEEAIKDINEADTISLELSTIEIAGLHDTIVTISSKNDTGLSSLITAQGKPFDGIKLKQTYIPIKDKIYTITVKKQELLFPLDIKPENTIAAMWDNSAIDLSNLSGRWVSNSRLPNNRETWIFDIDAQQNDIKIALNPNSGILNAKEWKNQNLFTPKKLYGIDSNIMDNSSNDIYNETLQMIKKIKTPVVSVIQKDDTLQFSFEFILDYNENDGNYDWVKQCGKGLLTIGKEAGKLLGGLLGLANLIPDNTTSKSTQTPIVNYIADVNFKLGYAPAGLIGSGREIFAKQVDDKRNEKNVHSFTHILYKVNNQYNGYGVSSFVKNRNQINKEKELIKAVKKGAKDNATMQYLLAILYSYSVGEKDFNDNTDKVYKQMMKAAKAGSLSAAEYIIKHNYSIASDNNKSKAVRKKSLSIAQEWNERIYPAAPGLSKCLQAQYAIDNNCDYDLALQLIREAVASAKDNGSFLNRLGELYLNYFNNDGDAIRCFAKAAELNNNDAMLNIAMLHRNGKNIPEYVKWTAKAFEYGNLQATKELSEIYFKGIGVKQDYQRGMKYAELYHNMMEENWKVYVSNIKPELLKILN